MKIKTMTNMIKKSVCCAVVSAAMAESSNWPVCVGIMCQPKHPRLMEAEKAAVKRSHKEKPQREGQ